MERRKEAQEFGVQTEIGWPRTKKKKKKKIARQKEWSQHGGNDANDSSRSIELVTNIAVFVTEGSLWRRQVGRNKLMRDWA